LAGMSQREFIGDGHWICPRDVQFTVRCCGSSETLTYTLPEK